MIVTKSDYDIEYIELSDVNAETVWATIGLKDQRKLVGIRENDFCNI